MSSSATVLESPRAIGNAQGARPLFSVIIPTFNYGRYLPRAVRSVLEQTEPGWELVVADDGSTDGTEQIVKGFSDPRIRYIRQQNAGPFAAVQAGFGVTCAPWVVVFDADDRLMPRALEHLRGAVGEGVRAVVGPWVSVSVRGDERIDGFSKPSGDRIADFRGVLSGRLRFVTGATALARTEIQRLYGWNAPVRHGIETMVFAHLAVRGGLVCVDQPLLAVHDHPGRLRDNLPSIVKAGTGIVDAVFNPEVVGAEAMVYRDEYLASVERERARTFYRAGCYRDAAEAFERAARAKPAAVTDPRSLRRWAVSRTRTLLGKPGLSVQERADAIARRRRDVPVAPLAGGDLRSFKADPFGTVLNASRTCGDVALLNLWTPTYLISHPEDMRHVLVTNAGNYYRSRFANIRRLFDKGLIADEGASHLAQRRMSQPFYTPRAASENVAPAVACLRRITDSWRDGQEVNIAGELLRANIGFAGLSVLGIDDQAEAESLFDMANRTLIKGVRMMQCPFHIPEAVPIRRHRLYKRYGDRLDARIGEIIDRRIAENDAERDDFLSHMISVSKAQPELLDRERMIAHAKTLFVAGGEPTATPTVSAVWRSALHPEYQGRLVEESTRVLGERNPVGADVGGLVFHTAFWREALRLHPSNWLMPRGAIAADTLPGGLKVKPGQELFISQYAMHMDERFFPDAERFDPERFSEAAMSARPRDVYMPFGRGPRSCIGATQAEQVGVALLAMLLRDWTFERVEGGDPVMVSPNLFISLIKETRLTMRVRRRTSGQSA